MAGISCIEVVSGKLSLARVYISVQGWYCDAEQPCCVRCQQAGTVLMPVLSYPAVCPASMGVPSSSARLAECTCAAKSERQWLRVFVGALYHPSADS